MLKQILLLALFLNVIYSSQINNGYIQNFQEQSEKIINSKEFADIHLEDLIRHNLGIFQNSAKIDQASKELIEKFGKGSALSPISLNYLFLIESQYLNKNNQSSLQSQPLSFNICAKQEDCLLGNLFDSSKNTSIISKIKEIYGEDKQSLTSLYSSVPELFSGLKDYLYSMKTNDQNKAQMTEFRTGNKFSIASDLEKCVNSAMKKKYAFNLKFNRINKIYSNDFVEINKENEESVKEFMQDICSVFMVAKLFQKTNEPNLFTFHLNSISKLEKTLPENQRQFIYDIWNLAYKQFTKVLQQRFKSDEIAGQIMFVENLAKDIKEVNNKQRLLQEEELNAEADTQTEVQTNTGAEEKTETENTEQPAQPKVKAVPAFWKTPEPYQKAVWFTVVLMVIIFFAVMTLVTMDFQKDTLLYAKFLAGEKGEILNSQKYYISL